MWLATRYATMQTLHAPLDSRFLGQQQPPFARGGGRALNFFFLRSMMRSYIISTAGSGAPSNRCSSAHSEQPQRAWCSRAWLHRGGEKLLHWPRSPEEVFGTSSQATLKLPGTYTTMMAARRHAAGPGGREGGSQGSQGPVTRAARARRPPEGRPNKLPV